MPVSKIDCEILNKLEDTQHTLNQSHQFFLEMLHIIVSKLCDYITPCILLDSLSNLGFIVLVLILWFISDWFNIELSVFFALPVVVKLSDHLGVG